MQMELFTNAGVALPILATPKAAAKATSQRSPLFNTNVIRDALGKRDLESLLTEKQIAAAERYAKKAQSSNILKEKETSVRPIFIQELLQEALGFEPLDPSGEYSLYSEKAVAGGSADVALGFFGGVENKNDILAPFELKGPGSTDLDKIEPSRKRSPVQQAWDYANDAPGSKWVLVSNCIEIRLYAYGRGRQNYEQFDARELDNPNKLARLALLLSAKQFLSGETHQLLLASDSAAKSITNELYTDYKALRSKVFQFLVDEKSGPRLSNSDAIEASQKILDRVLFIAFAQRSDLLPAGLIERASTTRNEFMPSKIWNNFQSLFTWVDKGHSSGIPAYNGGLFRSHPDVDNIILPDALAVEVASLGKWDYRGEVPVTVLGHIFEQSITDLEKLRAEARGEEAPKVSKSKKDGVVYTPPVVTRFLVERTIGRTLAERRHDLWTSFALPPLDTEVVAETETERQFWAAWLDILRSFTIVDPACGSGAFLVAAFDEMLRQYIEAMTRFEDLGGVIDFDANDEIVNRNLFGVDLNVESVEITRLSLWLKTARRDKKLQSLEDTIKVGNSLISDGAWTDRPFDWRAAFPQVFANGGFDVVIGNPPYVRMEHVKPFKPYLEQHFAVAADRADLYAYFFEKGIDILKDGGRLGYISSSTFFRTGSGANLRTCLTDGVGIEEVIDFGDLQLFDGVTTYPAILTLQKGAKPEGDLRFLIVKDTIPDDLGRTFALASGVMPRVRLTSGSWQFENDALAALRAKIMAGKKTLGEVYGAPLRGIVTGLNDAFIIDRATRDRLMMDPKSGELLVPFLKGENIKRWRVESDDLYLINTPKGKVDIDDYPLVKAHLLQFRKTLEDRATKQEWWELQQAQLAYQDHFLGPKIIYPHFQNERMFTWDEAAFFSNDKSYFIPNADQALLAYLNSKLSWFVVASLSPAVRNGWHEMRVQYLEILPIPSLDSGVPSSLVQIAESATTLGVERATTLRNVATRTLDLSPPHKRKLSEMLKAWHNLTFPQFLAAFKAAFGVEIPLKQRGEWQEFLDEEREKVRTLTAQIKSAEAEIDAIIYKLFDLSEDEIALIEANVAN